MKIKQKVDLTINFSLALIGIVAILLGILGFSNVKLLLVCIFILYALLNLIQFLLTNKSKDYEGLYTFIASITLSIICYVVDFKNVNNLTIVISAWVAMMSVIKFIKTDYYNDRKDRMWKIRIFTLLSFIIVGVLTSISLNYNSDVQVLILGYFFLIHGLLELVDPLTKYLIGR